MPRVLYFHENQLAFPVPPATRSPATTSEAWSGMAERGGRDLHFAFTQLVSALSATRCVFNSEYNRRSFLEEGARLLGRMPDAVPPGWIEELDRRSLVLPLPLDLPAVADAVLEDLPADQRADGPLLVWNHRWERDKGPGRLLALLRGLRSSGERFRLAVCGQRFRRVPPELLAVRDEFADHIEAWGWLESRSEYEQLLGRAQIVLSTAEQEFFGISILEATHLGAHPMVPDRLSYRELMPREHRYGDDEAAAKRLIELCRRWTSGDLDLRADRRRLTLPHGREAVLPRYWELFETLVAAAAGEEPGPV
jgi:glycosyltransferase involved in cell wall biosynthesis